MNAELKIVKVGNSYGVLLPREIMAKLRVGPGDKLFWSELPDGFTVRANDPAFAEVMAAAESIMREDRDILAVLAK